LFAGRVFIIREANTPNEQAPKENEDLDMRSSKTYSGPITRPQLSASFSLQLSSSLALIVSSLNFCGFAQFDNY
jgi:hypothetical protein